jgi:hypothetical protein
VSGIPSGVRYDPVVSTESTVVAEYVSETAEAAAYQSEAALEREFVGALQSQADMVGHPLGDWGSRHFHSSGIFTSR